MTDESSMQVFRKIIVGYDSRPEGRDALALGRQLAELSDAKLLLASVFPHHERGAGEEAFEQSLGEEGHRLFSPVLDQLNGGAVETFALADQSPAPALKQLAERERADLIVLGSTHRGTFGRVLPGGTCERLLTDARCAVAIAPRGFAGSVDACGFRVIAVAFDGSPEAQAALRLAAELAEAEFASLRVITVNASPGGLSHPVHDPLIRRGYRDALENAVAALPARLRPLAQLLDGDPARVLVDQVELGVDLLVMGSRGRGPLGRAVLGSVASKVLDSAACPVLLVPPGVSIAGRREGERSDTVHDGAPA